MRPRRPSPPQLPNGRAQAFVTALGGARNLTEVEACTTRLRLVLADNTAVDEAALKRLGARGIIRSSAQGLQVVLGPIADQVAGEIRAALRAASRGIGRCSRVSSAALGGRGNVRRLSTAAGRLLIRTAQPDSVDESALEKARHPRHRAQRRRQHADSHRRSRRGLGGAAAPTAMTRHRHSLQPLAPRRRRGEPKRRSALPATVRRIVVVGGGSAGWMTALTLARSLIEQGVEITVVESPTVGIIGVGEGSTPWLRGFFDSLGIEESEWMPACHATYKCGITFDGWSTKPGFERYFHPFASMLDNLTMTQFVHNADARVNGADVYAHPDRFFIASRLARQTSRAEARRAFPVRHLARVSLRCGAAGAIPAQEGRRSAASVISRLM